MVTVWGESRLFIGVIVVGELSSLSPVAVQQEEFKVSQTRAGNDHELAVRRPVGVLIVSQTIGYLGYEGRFEIH